MSDSGYVHINILEIIKETDLAFLIEFENEEQEWIPKSQIANAEDYSEGDADITLSLTEYIAKQKGLI